MRKYVKTKHVFWSIVPISLGILLAVIATKSIGYEKITTTKNTDIEITESIPITPNKNENFYFIKDNK